MRKSLAVLGICVVFLALAPWGISQVAPPAGVWRGAATATSPASAPAGARVVIISVDGLRPDLALRAQTPTLREMLKRGSYTFWARTTAASITLPSHTSMLTGFTPAGHGIMWNEDLPLKTPIYPRVPTLFEVAHKAGLTTAMAAGKVKFDTLAKPGTLDWSFVPSPGDKINDQVVADHAVAFIHDHQPQVLFVHLPDVDVAGHASGWGSPTQIAAIENADAQIRRILDALDQEHLHNQTLVIVTADHGGAGLTHGPDDPRSRHIPWIATGPGVHWNLDLTIFPKLTVNTEDTFATACWFLNIPLAPDIDGKPITQIRDPIHAVAK